MADREELDARRARMVYLVTYSHADDAVCASRGDFAAEVVAAFAAGGMEVLQWACCQEEHQDGGHHYHLAIKLGEAQRWLRVKQRLQDDYGMVVHFSGTHVNYYTAYQYVTKSDDSVVFSDGHPDLH